MGDNQNPNTPANKPLFITEEEATPPPLATQGIGGSVNQPAGIPADRPTEASNFRPTDFSASSLPPIMPAPPQKKGKGKLIAGIVAVLLIVVALPVGLILVGQSQEIRKQAAISEGGGGGSCGKDDIVGTTTDSDGCTRNIHTREDCTRYEGGPYSCPSANTVTPAPQPVTPPPSTGGTSNSGGGRGGDNSGPLTGDQAICGRDAGPRVQADDGSYIYTQGCGVVNAFADQYGTQASAWWAARHNLEVACTPTGIGADTNACDGQSMLSQNSLDVLARFYNQAKSEGNASRACINWMEEHNRSVNYCGGTPPAAGATTGGGGTAIGGSAPQCSGVRIYKYPYGTSNLISNGSQLRSGDPIKVCLVSTGNGTPMVNVNGREGIAQENGPQGEKCLQYDVPADATTLNARGWINY